MKKLLFATTAAGALAIGGIASAQAIELFGDARFGLGYNILNNGAVDPDDDDDLRAISRVRFGVRMTGETPTGITFGATIRADNASGGQGGRDGQSAGSVFASGAFGTLTFGDTNEAHQQHVGDINGVGLTGLGDYHEARFLGNRVFGSDYRPTVRYDYNFAGFGASLSTGRELDSVAVGASFSGEFMGGSFDVGAGYYDDDDDDQWAVGVGGSFLDFNARVNYTNADSGLETIGVGVGTTFADLGFDAFYQHVLSDDTAGHLNFAEDGDYAAGVGLSYNLGGGATLRTGVARTFRATDGVGGSRETVADFGIAMSF